MSEAYQTKSDKLSGTTYSEVKRKAYKIYESIKKRTKRRPYIRSAYFNRDKIFLGIFWSHLNDKTNLKDKTNRVKYFPCALELIRYSRISPKTKENPNKSDELLHRFFGTTSNGETFAVQIKEQKHNGQKFLLSVFPKK